MMMQSSEAIMTRTCTTDGAQRRQLWIPEPSLASVLETSGEERSSLVSLVEVLVERGELDIAVGLIRGLSIAKPDNDFFHCLLGMLLEHLGHHDEAFESYGRAIEANPEDVDSYVNRGEMSLAQGKLEAAKRDFLAAMALDPDGERSATERAWALNASATRRQSARRARTA